MSPITALIDTAPAMAPIQAFPQNLQMIQMPQGAQDTPFSSFFNAALNVVNDTNSMVSEFEHLQFEFATGRLDDILAVQMAQDRANNAINFTSQITSRIIESYREIMRMQI
ncbi:MAG: flagellar hook-basal body complex protein FliE [Defluviitaleaceae bacterium]|nr:flagellar hook-basal body complex protein FliE [Defluviitaleaceae bacterium]